MDDQTLLRYTRQIMLPGVDIEGQMKLGQSRVLIIGMGGLGSPVAMYLAAAGVGQLVISDFDNVELSNLQRQIIHASADIGRPKVDSAVETLKALNPLVDVTPINDVLAGEGLLDEVRRADVVVDACDNLATRLAVNKACVKAATPLVSGAAIRLEGQVFLYRPEVPTACYRCLFPSEQEVTDTCAESGVLAPLLGVIGSVQAVEVMKLLIGLGQPLEGILILDAYTMEWRNIRVRRNPRCPVCAATTPVDGGRVDV